MEDSEHLPHQNEVMKTAKSDKIRHHKSVKPVKLPAATSTRSPQNKVQKQVGSRSVDVNTLPRSSACLEAPPTQMTLSASNLGHKMDSVIEEKEFLDIEIESGVRVCVTDFSDSETVSPCNSQTFNPRGGNSVSWLIYTLIVLANRTRASCTKQYSLNCFIVF